MRANREHPVNSEPGFDLEHAHKYFVKATNNRTWELLSKEGRTADEQFEMQTTAQTSLYHWAQIGNALQLQRGEWLIGRVYAVLGFGAATLRHATRCHELTQMNLELMADFDIAYGDEGIARALALVGEVEQAKLNYGNAHEAAAAIANEAEREIFFEDFESGD
jgi:hypothetical protein